MVPGAGRLRQPDYLCSLPCCLLPPSPHVQASDQKSLMDGRPSLFASRVRPRDGGIYWFCLDLPSVSSACNARCYVVGGATSSTHKSEIKCRCFAKVI